MEQGKYTSQMDWLHFAEAQNACPLIPKISQSIYHFKKAGPIISLFTNIDVLNQVPETCITSGKM